MTREVVLRGHDGSPLAHGWIAEGYHWVDVAHVGIFRFDLELTNVLAVVEPGVSSGLVRQTYYGSVLPLALQAGGWEALHASGVRTSRGVLAFCALSETGKSTLAYAFSLRGYPLWSDDAVAFDATEERGIRCLPLPFIPQLRSDSRSFMNAGQNREPSLLEPAAVDDDPNLAAIVLLERDPPGGPIRVVRLSLPETMLSVLPHAYRFTLRDEARKRRTVNSYLTLLKCVPVFRARFPTEFERLPEVVERIEKALADEMGAANAAAPV